MPPAIIAAAATVASLVASHKQANAAKKAAATLADSSNQAAARSDNAMQQAMQYTMANQQATAQNYAPYIQQGQNAMAKLGRGLGLPPMSGQGGQPPMPPNMNAMMSNGQMPGGQMGQQGGGMVTIAAPDGSTKQVPAADVAKYAWAKRVN